MAGTQQNAFAINNIADSAYGYYGNAKKSPEKTLQHTLTPPRITAPTSGTIIALDPDIPPEHQRLQFSATGQGGRWLLNGKPLGRGPEVAWLPWPGRHTVQLIDAKGQVLDVVRLEVRGAVVRKK